MSPVENPAPESNFLVALLRDGAPVLATAPRELPDEVDDPTPVPATRRIAALAATDRSAPKDSLMIRATRYGVLLPLAFRALAVPVVWGWLVATSGFASTWPSTVVGGLSLVSTLAAIAWILKVPDLNGRVTRGLLYADVVFALASCLVVNVTVPVPLHPYAIWVPWVYLCGTVALWTIARGVPSGMAVVGLSLPLQAVMWWTGGPRPGGVGEEVAGALAGSAILVVASFTALGSLMLVGLGNRLALAIGIRNGRTAERARTERALHDTVLQVLESMAMRTSEDEADPRAELARLRAVARAQANDLRRGLDTGDGHQADGLGEELAAVATEMARDGLRAQLVVADVDDDVLSEVRRVAVRDAVREALRNTIKHAGTREVVVRLEEREGGIAVIARDHGIGYDEAERPPGFGVSKSMKARLAEVGGRCTVESRPGRGTRVTLWVPR
ncbi:sensor histidine kinase [Amycolatopsis sp. CA-230715]|uniref:sensor histidine kinase n=1 Tax=Amycolatopsis sp. CA-230715 TaxID=2745196 RepID=UPI001C0214FE|nr:ATP-binding protein [Amycolatopsis sp. CA-230715]QWF78140.1 hypothetical protein HUW46_01535 [Amycolatopsis sp. CA-230715]